MSRISWPAAVHPEATAICFPFSGDVVGGSHFSVLGLLDHFDPARYFPMIVPQDPDGAIARLFRDRGFMTETPLRWTEMAYDRAIGPRRMLSAARDIPAQIRYLRSRRYRIVHSNDGRTHATWALAARLSGAKLLWHQRGDPRAAGLRLAAPLLANQVVAVSHFAAPRPGLWSAARKTRVIHSAFNTAIQEDRGAARRTLLEELGEGPDTILLGYFGAFVGRKRPYLFIDAIAELRRRHPECPVIGLLFGEAYDQGRTEQDLEAHARRKGVAHAVRQMGFRSPGPYWLAACDALLVPARDEPFGRTLVEAMLVGTPVVATASGGNMEALMDGQFGLLVPPEDAGALADGVESLIARPGAIHAMTVAAMASARTRFGDRMHAEQIMAVYDAMLHRWPKRETSAEERPLINSIRKREAAS